MKSPKMILAFSGFNDPGNGANAVIDYLLEIWGHEKTTSFDSSAFLDLRLHKPEIRINHKKRSLVWPSTVFHASHILDENDIESYEPVILAHAYEPVSNWKNYIYKILTMAEELEVSEIITLGTTLSEIPHTRPMHATVTDDGYGDPFGPDYEGITGTLGAFVYIAHKRGFKTTSIWSTTPHYLNKTPAPSSTLALLHKLEDVLSITIPTKDLVNAIKEWEIGINKLLDSDKDMSMYVKKLEENKDRADIPNATGDSIAKEFERYLRHYNLSDE
jgi:hypothetical protein